MELKHRNPKPGDKLVSSYPRQTIAEVVGDMNGKTVCRFIGSTECVIVTDLAIHGTDEDGILWKVI